MDLLRPASQFQAKLPLSEALNQIRDAELHGQRVDMSADAEGTLIIINNVPVGRVTEGHPAALVVGCDLKKYGGLADLEQFRVVVGLGKFINESARLARIPENQLLGVSGTGDGALIAFVPECKSIWKAILFAASLWVRGQRYAPDRGLRVAVTRGCCILGREVGKTRQMQGYGLVEAARILSCDESVHFMVSLSVWNDLEKGEGHEVVGTFAGKSIELARTPRAFRGTFKPGDRYEVAFVNCYGGVRQRERVAWRFGMQSEDGLRPPGEKREAPSEKGSSP